MRALVSGAANSAPTRRDTTMGIGVIGLALLAAALGVVFPALERFVGTEIEAPLSAAALGLAAGAGGLALGWFVPVRRLMGPLAPWARRGFAVAGGFDGFVLRPAFAIAKACDRIDQRIYQSVLAIGRSARSAAAATERLERALYEKDLAIGPGNLRIGVWTRITDEKGVDGVIDLLVRGAIVAGGQARRLQSGLIHRELALTTIAVALLALALIAFSLFA
jgi:NADH-quinone oxidoreductase subunit L